MEALPPLFAAVWALFAAVFCVAFIIAARWVHQTHGMTAGYWILVWAVASWVLETLSGFAVGSISDEQLANREFRDWTLGEIISLKAYLPHASDLIAKGLLATLFCAEMLWLLSRDGERIQGVLAQVRELRAHRHRLGMAAVLVASLRPVGFIVVWIILEITGSAISVDWG